MDTYDLTGLDSQTAKEIIVNVIKSLKQTTAKRASIEEELGIWQGRVRLASEKGRSDLQAQAQTRVGDLEFNLDGIRAEEVELIRGVDRMKRQLKLIESQPQFSVDADMLLAELEILGGETDELAERFKEEEADALLDKLKKDMQDES